LYGHRLVDVGKGKQRSFNLSIEKKQSSLLWWRIHRCEDGTTCPSLTWDHNKSKLHWSNKFPNWQNPCTTCFLVREAISEDIGFQKIWAKSKYVRHISGKKHTQKTPLGLW